MTDKRKSKRLAKIRAAWRSYSKQIKQIPASQLYDKENIISTYREFEEIMRYDSSLAGKTNKAKVKSLIDLAKYQTNYRTARRFASQFRDESVSYDLQVEQVRQMHTHDLYNMHKDEIEAFKEDLMKQGFSNKEIAEAVSQYYFGS